MMQLRVARARLALGCLYNPCETLPRARPPVGVVGTEIDLTINKPRADTQTDVYLNLCCRRLELPHRYLERSCPLSILTWL